MYCTDPARYVNIHRAKLRLGLARARLGSRDRDRAWARSQRNVMWDSCISIRALRIYYYIRRKARLGSIARLGLGWSRLARPQTLHPLGERSKARS